MIPSLGFEIGPFGLMSMVPLDRARALTLTAVLVIRGATRRRAGSMAMSGSLWCLRGGDTALVSVVCGAGPKLLRDELWVATSDLVAAVPRLVAVSRSILQGLQQRGANREQMAHSWTDSKNATDRPCPYSTDRSAYSTTSSSLTSLPVGPEDSPPEPPSPSLLSSSISSWKRTASR